MLVVWRVNLNRSINKNMYRVLAQAIEASGEERRTVTCCRGSY